METDGIVGRILARPDFANGNTVILTGLLNPLLKNGGHGGLVLPLK
jgi:hypothetical protein